MTPEEKQSIFDLETKLVLPTGFCESLLAEDDWSFVIKLHAVFEAALSRLLSHHIGRPELLDIFSRMDVSNTSTGKLAFAKALGYLEDEERRIIRKWSELRNMLVHDVTNTSFDLKAHIELLKPEDQKQFLKGFFMEEWFQPDIHQQRGFSEAVANPKDFLFRGAMSLLSQLSSYFEWAEYDQELAHQKWLKKMIQDCSEE